MSETAEGQSKLWVYVAGAIAAVIAGICVAASFQPEDFRIVRSATVKAPAPAVFEQVNNLRNWDSWSPWARLDPSMKKTFTGPEAGAGASYSWSGNSDVGEGRMTITESRPGELVAMKLEFLKPFEATNTAEFTFQSDGEKTTVAWAMSGKNSFMGKVFSLLMNMDKMVGGDFEKGLASLKAIVEKPSVP